jgi:hypothetical protein
MSSLAMLGSVWSDPAWWGVLAAFAAVIVPALIAVFQMNARRVEDRRHGLAQQYGDALAAALAWCETPFRVARRTDDAPQTLSGLADALHELHQRIDHAKWWLQVESPKVANTYAALVDAVRTRTQRHLTAAWERSAVTKPTEMSFGGNPFPVDISNECNAYLTAVRDELGIDKDNG